MKLTLLGIYLLTISGVISAQAYIQFNGGVAVGAFNVSIRGQAEYYVKKESKWTKGLIYHHQVYSYTAAKDQINTESNYHSFLEE